MTHNSALSNTGSTGQWRRIRETILQRDGYVCQQCGSEEQLTVDHIIPRAKQGTDDPENLQTLCSPCNVKKSDKLTSNADKAVFLETQPTPRPNLYALSPMKRIEPISPLESPYDNE